MTSPTPWAMPPWMEPYRDLILDGDRAEELMNNRSPVQVNAPLALHACNVAGYVGMLARLHEAGLLPARTQAPETTRGH